MPYKLSEILKAHTSDVRALSTPTDQLILSSSRDSTAISWQRSPSDQQFKPEVVIRAGSRYVNSVAYIAPTPDAPKGYVVTGGQDAVINIFNLETAKDDPDFCLLGHLENICALDVTPGGTIISGSWDKTAKVWKNFNLTHDLKGHQQSVWAVLAIDEEQYLTGSADKTIKLWRQHKDIHTFTGHTDAVRGLALIPDIGFASCSNDSEIRVWTFGGDHVYSLSGHTSFVYSLSVLPSGDIVSSGEDRTVRVWKDGECSQTIVHPAISVWAVSTLPNGDIVSGASDGVVRVFSESEERWASAEVLKTYDEQVASQALPLQQVGDVKKSDLPGLEALTTPGKKSGEVKMVKNGELVEAHQWDSMSFTWQKIGDVVDAVGSGRKQLYQGKEYDYVFDVDIKDGVPPLKLPYNVSENPYTAAQRFLQSNDLPLTYIDEVVKFIETNTAGVKIGTGGEEYVDPFTGASRYRSTAAPAASAASDYVDPFTGASRYVSSQSGASSGSAAPSQYVDPFTGASRYVASPGAASSAPSALSGDPFTGASRYSGAAQVSQLTPAPAPAAKILPAPKLVTFKQANVRAMQSKLFQFDDALRHEISTSSLAMYPDEIHTVEETFLYLTQLTSTPPVRQPSPLTAVHVEAIISILDRWPPSQRFPVIDLSRLLVGFCPEAFGGSGSGLEPNVLKERFAEALFQAAEWGTGWTPPLPKARETNMLLVLRTLANVFKEDEEEKGKDADVDMDGGDGESWLDKVLETLGLAPYEVFNKTQRVAFATFLFNLSCQGLRTPLGISTRDQAVGLINRILEQETADSEAVYRALVALGNVAYAAKSSRRGLNAAQAGEIGQCLQALPGRFPEARVKNMGREIDTVTQMTDEDVSGFLCYLYMDPNHLDQVRMSRVIARIYLVRHGETQENRDGIIQGQKDTKLNEVGEEQARMVGERLKEEKIDWAVSSDLQRAVKTAEAILAHHVDVKLDMDTELRERCMGSLEGRPGKETRLVAATGVETGPAFEQRTMRWWNQRILGHALSRRKDSGETLTVLVTTHGGFITALVRALVESRKARGAVVSKCCNASLTVIDIGENRKGSIIAYGDVTHLRAHDSLESNADFHTYT